MKKLLALLLPIALMLCAALPSEAQVPAGLMRFGTTGVFIPQTGDCLSILAMNSSGQTATDSAIPCSLSYLATAYTNATTGYTAVLALPALQANVVAHGECTLTYADSSTSGTVTFAAQLSAAPTDLWVTTVANGSAYLAPTYYTITNTTQTPISSALAIASTSAQYQVHFAFTLATSSVAASTLTIYAVSNNASYTATVEPGSACEWVP